MKKISEPLKMLWIPFIILNLILLILVYTKNTTYSYWVFVIGFFYAYRNGWRSRVKLMEDVYATMDVFDRVKFKTAEEALYDKEDLEYYQDFKRGGN